VKTVDAARRWGSVWRSGWESKDTDSIVALYADEARHWSAPFRGPGIGRDGVRAYVQQSFDEEDEIHAWFAEPVVDGERAAVACWATLVELGKAATVNEVEAALAGDHIDLVSGESDPPSNLSAAGQEDIMARVRKDSGVGEKGTRFWIWLAADNLKLMALNAIACATELRRLRPLGKVQ